MIGKVLKWAAGLFARPQNPVRGMLLATCDRGDAPRLRLKAASPKDLQVLSALSANAVGLIDQARYAAGARRLTLQMSRYRHEARGDPDALGPHGERVSAMLEIRGVLGARTLGSLDRDAAQAYEILALTFEPEGGGPGGTLNVVCAPPFAFAARVEALEALLSDMSEPWPAAFDPLATPETATETTPKTTTKTRAGTQAGAPMPPAPLCPPKSRQEEDAP